MSAAPRGPSTGSHRPVGRAVVHQSERCAADRAAGSRAAPRRPTPSARHAGQEHPGELLRVPDRTDIHVGSIGASSCAIRRSIVASVDQCAFNTATVRGSDIDHSRAFALSGGPISMVSPRHGCALAPRSSGWRCGMLSGRHHHSAARAPRHAEVAGRHPPVLSRSAASPSARKVWAEVLGVPLS
jgi:hypothetical protein